VTLVRDTIPETVPVSKMFLDRSYGREPNERHVAMLAGSWDRAKANAVILSLRDDGTYAVLDGWHRVTACREVEGNEALLPALVYIDLTLHREAELFVAFNRDKRKLNAAEIFRAELAEGNSDAKDIYKLVTGLDLDISWNGAPGENLLVAVGALKFVASQFGLDMLREVLLTIRNTQGTHSSSFANDMMLGLAGFLSRYGDLCDRTRLFAVLSQHSPGQVRSLAHTIQAASPGTAPRNATGMAFLQMYNHGLRTKHLPAWQTYAFSRPETRQEARDRAAIAQGKRPAVKAKAARRGT